MTITLPQQHTASDEAKAHNLGVNLERSMEVGKLYELATLVHKNFWSNRNYVSAFFEKVNYDCF